MDPAAAPVEPPWPLCRQRLHHGLWASSWPRQGSRRGWTSLHGSAAGPGRWHVPIPAALPGSPGQSPISWWGWGWTKTLCSFLPALWDATKSFLVSLDFIPAWCTANSVGRGEESCWSWGCPVPAGSADHTKELHLGASGCLGDVSQASETTPKLLLWSRHSSSLAPGWGRGSSCSWRGMLPVGGCPRHVHGSWSPGPGWSPSAAEAQPGATTSARPSWLGPCFCPVHLPLLPDFTLSIPVDSPFHSSGCVCFWCV